jgi:hypothetical protein
MSKFFRILAQIFVCLSTIILPVIKALITAFDYYANKENAYTAV